MRRFEPLTSILIAACLAGTVAHAWFGVSYLDAGAVEKIRFQDGEYWRPLTGMFVHGGWLHFSLNALSLYFVGRAVAAMVGRPLYLACLVVSALAGFAASLFTTEGFALMMGISGGVAGLLGLILAIEWDVAGSWRQFLKARNTLVIAFFIALSVVIGVWIERSNPGVKIDHAAHAGGLLCGLGFGLAVLARRRVRPVRGALAALLLGVVPLAYAAYPALDADFLLRRADRHLRAGDGEAAADLLERVLWLRPGHVVASAFLADARDDPSYLDGIEPGLGEARIVVEALLVLAERRFADGGASLADGLAGRASELRAGSPARWRLFARRAREAGRSELAELGVDTAFRLAQGRGRRARELWTFAWPVLGARARALGDATPEGLLGAALDAAYAAEAATWGLGADLDDGERARLDQEAAELLRRAGAAERTVAATADAEGLGELRRLLHRGFERLARNTESDARRPRYRYWSAFFWWEEVKGTDAEAAQRDAVRARAKAALDEAVEAGDRQTEALVRRLLGGELAGDDGGG